MVQEKENEMIAAADGKSRGVLNDETAGAQGDHHLIYFDQTARPLAQGGPSNNLTDFGPYHFCLNFQNLYY
jgi:hypothetical protein